MGRCPRQRRRPCGRGQQWVFPSELGEPLPFVTVSSMIYCERTKERTYIFGGKENASLGIYATTEIAQDRVFCELLSYSNNDKHYHNFSIRFSPRHCIAITLNAFFL